MIPANSVTGLLWVLSTLVSQGEASSLDAVAADRLRIRAHLAQVESELRSRDVSDIPLPAQAARSRALDTLHRYWEAGQFPHNQGPSSERIPIFIDAEARPCAVAQLMLKSGARALAQRVAAHENHARVLEMQTDLSHWLTENGLTAEEAARIQPDYCFCSDHSNPVCATVSVDGGTKDFTFLNQCVVERCSVGATLLHEGACTGPDAALAPKAISGDQYCTCPEKADTAYACSCHLPIASKKSAPLGVLSLLVLAVALVARWTRRR